MPSGHPLRTRRFHGWGAAIVVTAATAAGASPYLEPCAGVEPLAGVVEAVERGAEGAHLALEQVARCDPDRTMVEPLLRLMKRHEDVRTVAIAEALAVLCAHPRKDDRTELARLAFRAEIDAGPDWRRAGMLRPAARCGVDPTHLARLLLDPSRLVREQVLYAMERGDLSGPPSIPVLVEVWVSRPEERERLATIVGSVDAHRSLGAALSLERFARSENLEVRLAAAEMLKVLGRRADLVTAVARESRRLGDPDERDRAKRLPEP